MPEPSRPVVLARRRRVLLTAALPVLLAACSAGGAASAANTAAAPTSASPTATPTSTAPTSSPRATASASARSSVTPTPTPTPTTSPVPVIPLHAPLTPLVPGALAGQGVFGVAVLVHGQPAVQVTHMAPSAAQAGYSVGVVWMSGKLLRYQLHPGYADPAQLSLWNQPDLVPVAERPSLVATFNGGFHTRELRGGFYENGHVAGALLPGAASLVIYNDGHVNIGAWGSEVRMTPSVAAVRQNLYPMIDHGVISPTVDYNTEGNWGPTLGGVYATWRSGVGVTAAGDTVLVMGDGLTPRSLANLLLDAGAVRAMEMDINPAWMSFMWYIPGPVPTQPIPNKLVAFLRPADRYFTDTSRDFFAVLAR